MKKILSLIILLLIFNKLFSNNIEISNIRLNNKDTVKKTIYISFDLSWENSWKIAHEPANWDAAWIFVKFKEGKGIWQHAKISSLPQDHFVPMGAGIETVEDSTGVFISRSGFGSGNNSWKGIRLLWDYGKSGLSNNAEDLSINVFGIEMVYVNAGNFYAGDGRSMGRFRNAVLLNTLPAYISPSPIVIRCEDTSYDDAQLEGPGILLDGDEGIDVDGNTEIDNPDFPTGINAFYCMKYEVSQEQYVEFLNTLTRKQQNTRTIQDISGEIITHPFAFNFGGLTPVFRNSIRCSNISGGTEEPVLFFCDLNNNNVMNEPDDGQNIALSNFGWIDAAAYADWAGLRPMTELEFEKACRGAEVPVEREYAWHTTDIYAQEYLLTNSGFDDETPANPGTGNLANASHISTTGHDTEIETPLRCGAFANENSDRVSSGASYYGIMELSGNLNEACVTLGHIQGRTYKGTHGDGKLTDIPGYEGNATNTDWPGRDPQNPEAGVIAVTGSGSRGGDWNDYYLYVSSRYLASGAPYGRNPGSGFRAVRSVKQ